ncbi:hypothetical protein BSZ36_11880 [Rubricoccus marinus]|uniref:DNA mismatch repair protein MutL n=1 Tax=Rubricoccus marinus TaxID=716817 RepID=A0A259U434_9BACT|nr:hypothetical protein BSZ36_11880 [Rubricoccus marinus]
MPDTLASKIAAGEVVQRPANAVKELVENALDAGAGSIELTVQRAGSELIQVADDGCGMGPEDARGCFGRHATSKLRAFEDLETLRTLGFRGEALASIAAVSRVELKTRRAQDEAGTCIRVHGGDIVESTPCAAPTGTTISVRDLFYNVPARRAFLRTPATEFKHIVETFQALALSHPTVAFCLVHDGTEVYRLPAAGGAEPLAQRVADLFGSRYEGTLVPVAEATSYLSIRGVVGAPEVARRSRGDQYVFANGRYVKSRSLEHAAARAFGALLPDGRYPFLALFLDVDPRHLDVNVHPTKTEVKFDDERGVYSFVGAVVKKGLSEAGLALDLAQTAPQAHYDEPLADAPSGGDGSALPPMPAFAPETGAVPASLPPLPTPEAGSEIASGDWGASFTALPREPGGPVPSGVSIPSGASLPSNATLPGEARPAPSPRPFRQATGPLGPIPSRADGSLMEGLDSATFEEVVESPERTVWPFRGRYLLTPVASGLLVVDQRAAHERVLYEAAIAALEGGMGATQQLLFPYTLDLPPDDRALLDELLPDLQALGFDVALGSKGTVEVRGVPADVSVGDERAALPDLLDRYRKSAGVLQLSSRETLARSLARRSAYREGDILEPLAARVLIEKLFTCGDPFTDPAGRPTMIRIAESEIERRFG